jgi:hypothetical protein
LAKLRNANEVCKCSNFANPLDVRSYAEHVQADVIRRHDVANVAQRSFATSFCSYPKVAISEHFTVNQAQTLIEAQSLI